MATKHNRAYGYHQAMAPKTEISCFLDAIIPLRRFDFTDIVFTRTILIFIAIMSVLPLPFFFEWHYRSAPAEDPQTYTLQQATPLYAKIADDYTYEKADNKVERITNLAVGSKIQVLGAKEQEHILWVQTPRGERGFIGYKTVMTEEQYKSILDEVPEIFSTKCIPVSGKWLNRRIEIGTTTRQDVADSWWGEPYAIKKTAKGEDLYLPMGNECIFHFENDKLVGVTPEDKLEEFYIPGFSLWIDSAIYTRIQTVDMVRDHTEGLAKFLPEWALNLLAVPVFLVLGLFFYVSTICHLILFPALILKIGEWKRLPRFVFRLLLYIAGLFSAIWLALQWQIGGMIAPFGFIYFCFRWRKWEKLNHCPHCHQFYTMEVYDVNYQGKEYIKTTVKNEYLRSGGFGGKDTFVREVSRKSEKREAWSSTEFYRCEDCGGEMRIHYSGDTKLADV